MCCLRGKLKNEFILTWSKKNTGNRKNPGHVLSGVRMSTNRDGRSAILVQREQGEAREIDGRQLIKGITGQWMDMVGSWPYYQM